MTSPSISVRLGKANGFSAFSWRYSPSHLLLQPIELGVVGVVDEAEGAATLPVGVTVAAGTDGGQHLVDGHRFGREVCCAHGPMLGGR